MAGGAGDLADRLAFLLPEEMRSVRAWQAAGLSLRESLSRVEEASAHDAYRALFGAAVEPPTEAAAGSAEERGVLREAAAAYRALFGGEKA